MNGLLCLQFDKHGAATRAPSVVEIRDFGKIGSARIELTPFTILVGRNSTGKSYAAYLIWALRSAVFGLAPFNKNGISAPKWFRDYVKSVDSGMREPIELPAERLLPHYNKWLARHKDELVADLLSLDDAKIGQIRLHASGSVWLTPTESPPKWVKEGFDDWSKASNWIYSWTPRQPRSSSRDLSNGMVAGVPRADRADTLYRGAIEKLIVGKISSHWGTADYIPAARTGLVLALADIAAKSLHGYGAIEESAENRSKFTTPMRRFLSSLIRRTSFKGPSRHQDVADFLVKNIYGGELEVEGEGVPKFTYVTSAKDVRLPMHAVSSMISEVTPILAILKTHVNEALIIEEPEAHLHLSAQRYMARALVQLCNSGVPVALRA